MLDQLKPVLEAQSSAFDLIFSLAHSIILLTIVGITTCIVIIFLVRKIKRPDLIRKKLSIILIIAGIILFILPITDFLIVLNFTDEVIGLSSIPAGYYNESIMGILIGIIPSVILIISGILAMKFNENQKLNI